MEIKSDREYKNLRNKTLFYLFLDVLLLGSLIAALIQTKKSDCEDYKDNGIDCLVVIYPPLLFIGVCVACSFILDFRTF